MIKKLPAYISFVLFISFLALSVFELTGQSDIISVFISEYLDFLKQGPYLIIAAVFVFFSLGAARIVAFGLFRNVASVKKKFTTRIFLFSFFILLFVQIIGTYMLRAINIEQP